MGFKALTRSHKFVILKKPILPHVSEHNFGEKKNPTILGLIMVTPFLLYTHIYVLCTAYAIHNLFARFVLKQCTNERNVL